MARPRVFVVQRPSQKREGLWRPKFDISPAEHFGEIITLLPPGNLPPDPKRSVERLAAQLFDFSDDDFILPAGDPIAIAATAILASRANDGAQTFLKWDRMENQYREYRLLIKE